MLRVAEVALALVLVACDGASLPPRPLPDGEVGFPDAGPALDLPLALHAVVPSRGPFTGGNEVVLRATGLSTGTRVSCRVLFGGVEATSLRFVDENRLEVVVPPGDAGPVDVRIVHDGEEATLANGYTFDALAVSPAAGSEGGGTYVTVRSAEAAFDASAEVRFGHAPCTGVVVEAPDRITCFTPPGDVGVVDVEARGSLSVIAPEAFRYEDPTIEDGGLGGGPLGGTLEVVVRGPAGPIEGAIVLAGPGPDALLRATTDVRGLAAIGGPAFSRGPIDLHASAPCHFPTSMVRFDAARATIDLARDWADACALPFAPGSGTRAAYVSGELDVQWAGVPKPEAGEQRVVHVMTTHLRSYRSAPDPGAGGRVIEGDERSGYRIVAGPGLVAVIALAGVESAFGDFRPAAMGIARGVLLAPGEDRTVHLRVDIPLDQRLRVSLDPPADERQSVTAHLRLEEGFVVRDAGTADLDRAAGPDLRFEIPHQPALGGALADARFEIEVSRTYATGGWSTRRLRDVESFDIHATDFLAVPRGIEPVDGARFDGTLRWSTGGEDASFTYLALSGAELAWWIFGPGDLSEVHLPALADLGLERPLDGDVLWTAARIVVPGLEYDAFRYAALEGARYGTHEAACVHTARW